MTPARGRVVVAGSYNADLTVVAGRLPREGETVLGHRFHSGPGGKGANQAIGARRLGAEVTFLARLGRDPFGAEARELLRREGLPDAGILSGDGHTGVALIVVDAAGRNQIAVAPGANAQLRGGDADAVPGLLDGAAVLLCQLECPAEVFLTLAGRARAAGATTILNPAPAAGLPADAYRLADFLTPNERELAVLAGAPVRTTAEAVRAARTLLARGAGNVVATLGARGAVWVSGEVARVFPAERVDPVDSTGAGDAFNAGLAAGLARGLDVAEAILLASRCGAFCVTRNGVLDGLPHLADLEVARYRPGAAPSGDGR